MASDSYRFSRARRLRDGVLRATSSSLIYAQRQQCRCDGDSATGAASSVVSTSANVVRRIDGPAASLQKEGLLASARRRGGLLVFGQALQRADLPRAQTPTEPAELQAVTIGPAEPIETETEHEETERIPIDTTAELLGRANAKPRPTRAQSTRVGASAPRGTRKAAAAPRKPAARRAPRAGKTVRTDAADEGNK